jgi:hypothetical protein
VESDSDETSNRPMSAHFLIKLAMVAGERLFKDKPLVEAVRGAIDATADQFGLSLRSHSSLIIGSSSRRCQDAGCGGAEWKMCGFNGIAVGLCAGIFEL